jgi:hypothetical protein
VGIDHKTVATVRSGMEGRGEIPHASDFRLGLSLNFDRRHLTTEQKRAAAAELLKAEPAQSDLAISKAVGLSATTIGTVRTELEEAGDVSKLETRTDTKGRKQPARKPRSTASKKPGTGNRHRGPFMDGIEAKIRTGSHPSN